MRSCYGQGRHRQSWVRTTCPCCRLEVVARRTLPGQPLHVRAHFTDEGVLCPCNTIEQVVA